MSIDSIAATATAQAATSLQREAGMSVLKKALDAQGAVALKLLEGLDPNLGSNVDVRV